MIGAPGVGKSYLSQTLFSDYKDRDSIKKNQSLLKLLNFVFDNRMLIIRLIIFGICDNNKKRVISVIYEMYIVYIIKRCAFENVVLDQSILQAVIAYYSESRNIDKANKLLSNIESFYVKYVDVIYHIINDNNVVNLSKRITNNCSFDIYDLETSKEVTEHYNLYINSVLNKGKFKTITTFKIYNNFK